MSAFYILVSLSAMQPLNSKPFLRILRNLYFMEGVMRLEIQGHPEKRTVNVDAGMRRDAREICELLGVLGMQSTKLEAERFRDFVRADTIDATIGAERINSLTNRIRDDLVTKRLLLLNEDETALYECELPFGDAVFAAFPSANEDIAEAAKCLGLSRPTACVMHSVRVVEVGLKALGKAVGIGPQNDWGSYLREIEIALTKSAKAAGSRTPLEQFYSEAAASIDNVRRAWRNPTMHVDRSYSVERATEIFNALRSLMRHLST
jgi:hypothetical protein